QKSTTEIAIDLGMPLRCIQRCGIMTWQLCRVRGLTCLADPNDLQFVLGLLRSNPDYYLDEIKAQLLAVYDIEVSLTTIWRTLKYLGLSKKKVSRNASERDEELRRDFMVEIGKFPPEYLVFADESAVNVLTTYRDEAWAP
ncbi:hypothetical protein GGX14DRAFT_324055, partial [Mycena pura]